MIYEVYSENGTKKKRALTGNGYGLPLGTWISYEGACPDGFLEAGTTFNTTTYAALYAMLGSNKVPERFDHSKLSDFEDITISTDSNNPTPIPYDGFVLFQQAGNSTQVSEFSVYVNGTLIGMTRAASYANRDAEQCISLPVKKGDTVYTSKAVSASQARYYKRHLAIKATPAYVEPDTVSDMVNTLRTQDSYSTSEVNTGKKWIDGKPIYRKTYVGDPVPLSVIATLNAFEDWNIPIPANAETLVKSEVRGFNSVAKYYSFFFATASICFNNATGNLTLWSGSNTGTVKQATIYYTKTTD